MPNKPRSPAESVVTVRNGVAQQRVVFDDAQLASLLADKHKRPSGAKPIAVGLEMPLAMADSLNPGGSVAAEAAPAARTRRAQAISFSFSFDFMGFIFVAGLLSKNASAVGSFLYPVFEV